MRAPVAPAGHGRRAGSRHSGGGGERTGLRGAAPARRPCPGASVSGVGSGTAAVDGMNGTALVRTYRAHAGKGDAAGTRKGGLGGVYRCPSGADEVHQSRHVHHPRSVACGDGGRNEGLDQSGGEVAQGCHGLRAVAGADAATILVVGHVPDVVQTLDRPVPADLAEDHLFIGAVRGLAGGAVDDLVARCSVAERGGSFQPEALLRMWEAQSLDARSQLDGPFLDPSVALFTLGVAGEKDPSPWRRAADGRSFGCP